VVGGGKRTLDVFFLAKKLQDAHWEVVRGGLFLTKGEREFEAPTRGEVMTRREAAAGTLSGRGSAKRGDVTTSRGK
jgi:hypothetical protein